MHEKCAFADSTTALTIQQKLLARSQVYAQNVILFQL